VDDLGRWLRRQAEREARRPSLEEALLGNSFRRYGAYRLRYFLARWCASAALHASVVWLLYRSFGNGFSWILGTYAAVGFVESFWWGALEAMRGRVRALHRAGKAHLVPAEVARWLSLAVQLSLVTVAAVVGWLSWQLTTGPGLDPARVYVAVLVFGLAVQLVTRCYHSGIYALRRVYRPLGAIVALEGVSLVGILLLRPLLGTWGFPIAALVSTLAVSGLSLYYTRRSYQLLRLSPETRLAVHRVQLPDRAATAEMLSGGLSFGVMSLDSLLVLLLLGTQGGQQRSPLFVLFFIASPTIRAGFDWARLLYFDFKRLEIRMFRNLRRRFRRAAIRLGLLLAIVFWVAASLTGSAVLGHGLGGLYGPLLAFFVARSLLAVTQVDAFTNRAYARLLAIGLACLAAFVVIGLLVHEQEAMLVWITGVTLLAATLLLVTDVRTFRRNPEILWLSEWLTCVRAVSTPTRICAAALWSEPLDRWSGTLPDWHQRQRWRRRRLADDIVRRLKSHGAVTIIPSGAIVWFERGENERRVGEEWLLRRSAGFVESVRDQGLHAGGTAALEAACRTGVLGTAFREAVQAERRTLDLADVERAFKRHAPSGVVYDPDEPVPASLERLPSKDKREIVTAAASFARDFQRKARRSRFDVTALCDKGELRQIFVAPSDLDGRSWHALIGQINIEAAVGTVTLVDNADSKRANARWGRIALRHPVRREADHRDAEPVPSPNRSG
jgi:hypothetical protein